MIGTDATRSDRYKFRRRAEPVWTNLWINTAVRARAGCDGAAHAFANAAVEAEIDGLPGQRFSGKIVQVAAGLDERTRLLKVVAEVRPGVTIGLIPCPVGGSPIDTWQPGVFDEATRSFPWDDMMRRIQVALPAGTLKGILWHQGESDSKPELAVSYEAKLHALIARFRVATGAPEVPFVVGQMGRYDGKPWDSEREVVDQAHQALPKRVANAAFVSSEGLKDKGDQIHFDAESYRELGRRYAKVYLGMSGGR